eukprot:jgi/Ulvmu1/7454/UM036_0116.1
MTAKHQDYPSIPHPEWGTNGGAPAPPSSEPQSHQPEFPAASRPPVRHPHHQPSQAPLPLQAVLLPLRLANGVFGLACKATLGPVRAVLGQRIPLCNRRHLVLLPERVEKLLGTQTFFKAKATSQVLPGRHRDVELVTRISRRIIDALPKPGSGPGYIGHLARCQWEFAVVHSPQVNAVVVPGGKVIVYTGLLDMIDRDEDKLAAVLGHEAAHVVARHSAEGVGLRVLLGGVGWLVCATVGRIFSDARLQALRHKLAGQVAEVNKRYRPGTPEHQAAVARAQDEYERALMQAGRDDAALRNVFGTGVRFLSNLLVGLPNSRRAESEADLIGLKLMAKAGYDIHSAPAVWDDFAAKAGGPGGATTLLSTHPSNSTRKNTLEQEVGYMKARGWSKGHVPQAALQSSATGRGYFAI